MTAWVAIQRNPSSGAGRQNRAILDLIRGLKAQGLRPRLYSQREALDEAVQSLELREGLVAIVAAGGDGTLVDVINRHPSIPICPFPLGTENLVAKWLKIPRCGATVAEIIARGHRKTFGQARLNNRHFLVMASIGLDAAIVHAVHAQRMGGHVRHWSYVVPTLRALWNYRPTTLRVYVDDAAEPVEGEFVVIANLPTYALQMPVVPTASGVDGLLHMRVFRLQRGRDVPRLLWSIRRGTHEQSLDVIRLTGRRFRIESDIPVPIQADGDPLGMTPVEMEIEPSAVELIVPGEDR